MNLFERLKKHLQSPEPDLVALLGPGSASPKELIESLPRPLAFSGPRLWREALSQAESANE